MSSILQKTRYVVYRRIGAARPRRNVPLQNAYLNAYHEEMTDFLGGIFSAALKTNEQLSDSFKSGIRVGKVRSCGASVL